VRRDVPPWSLGTREYLPIGNYLVAIEHIDLRLVLMLHKPTQIVTDGDRPMGGFANASTHQSHAAFLQESRRHR
jgi:hypothetical protein